MLARAENQHNKLTKKLTGENAERERPWFQTPQQRKAEKERLALNSKPSIKKELGPKQKMQDKPINGQKPTLEKKNKKTKNKKNSKQTPEDRAEAELEKVALYQARLSKRNKKPKRIRTVYDNDAIDQAPRAGQKRKASNFTNDLTDVSRKGAKRLRYDANVRQKEIKTGRIHKKQDGKGGKKGGKTVKGAKGGVRAPKGKAFGKPQKGKNK